MYREALRLLMSVLRCNCLGKTFKNVFVLFFFSPLVFVFAVVAGKHFLKKESNLLYLESRDYMKQFLINLFLRVEMLIFCGQFCNYF